MKKEQLNKILSASELLKAISNPNRLSILCNLIENELSVGELVEKIDLSQSALSQHLAKLRELNIVKTRKQQQVVYYSISSNEAKEIIGTLKMLYC